MTSAGMVMTNKGPRSGRKPTLDPLPATGGLAAEEIYLRSSSPTGMDAVERSLPSHSKLLPPLGKSTENLDSVHEENHEGASPTRRARHKNLVTYGEGGARSVIQASLEVDKLDADMSLVRENRRDGGNVLLELWVNQVLDPTATPSEGLNPNATEPLRNDVAMLKGLIAYGLTRQELIGAGLPNDSIDRLYRGLYVYTIGFFDVMQDILQNNEFRMEILSNVWRAYLYIAESALKVAFKSDYLHMFQAQQITAAELLVAKEALNDARVDSYKTEKALAWLTSAHAEERSLRVSLKLEVEEAQTALDRERRAHQAAVQKYVSEAELRSKYYLEIQDLHAQLDAGTIAAAELVRQRDEATKDRDRMEQKCICTLERLGQVYTALTLDESLGMDLPKNDEIQLPGLDGMRAKAAIVATLTEEVYGKWRVEKAASRVAATSLYDVKDKLRVNNSKLNLTTEELQASQKEVDRLKYELEGQLQTSNRLQEELDTSMATLYQTTKEKKAAETEIVRLNEQVADLENMIKDIVAKREEMSVDMKDLYATLATRDATIAELSSKYENSQWVSAQMSKGMSVAMGALYCNQTARSVLQRRIAVERSKHEELQLKLGAADRQVRLLEGKVSDLSTEILMEKDNSERCAQEARHNSDQLDEALKQLQEAKSQLLELTTSLKNMKLDVMRLETELVSKVNLLAQATESLGFEKNEVMRLYKSLQSLEDKLRSVIDERMEVVKKMERNLQEMAAIKDKFRRKEEMLNLEIKRIQSEVRLERTRNSGLELQIEAQRKKVDELGDALERKREKKRKWKGLHVSADANTAHLKQLLDDRDASMAVLEQKLGHIDVDLAILVADRGRKPPGYHSGHRDDPGGNAPSPPGTASTPGTALPPLTPETPTVPDILQDLLPQARASVPVEDSHSGLQHVISDVYGQWDQANRVSLDLQKNLEVANKSLEVHRNQYERARAIFYGNPTEAALKERMEGKEKELRAVREKRTHVEAQLNAVGDHCRQLQAQLRTYEQRLTRKRLDDIEWRTASRDDALQTELSHRVDDAEKRARNLQEMLATQKTAYDMLEATRSTLEGEIQKQEIELNVLASKLSKITDDKIETDKTLVNTKDRVIEMQGELADMTQDRDKHKENVYTLERKIRDLDDELIGAKKSIETSLARLEKKHVDEKRDYDATMSALKSELETMYNTKKAELGTMTTQKLAFEKQLKMIVAEHLARLERIEPPQFMQHFLPDDNYKHALKLLPNLEVQHNFNMKDPVTDYLVPTFDSTMVIISQIYTDKIISDLAAEEQLLGGGAGRRCSLMDKVYEYFIKRYGTRQPAELNLCAFLDAVKRYRSQHPKIRSFSRLVGFCDEGEAKLPPGAADFYLAVFNRIHARAGPLVAEAAEGYSLVKCKIISKVFREMTRGAFANLHDDAASMTEKLRGMAMNDEEKHIDLETAMEMLLMAWEVQYKQDTDAIVLVARNCFESNKSPFTTPEDLHRLLEKLEPAKALLIPLGEETTIFRRAMRNAGPTGREGAHTSLAEAILYFGFVGLGGGITTRLETVRTWPPYDEFRTLEESWRVMRSVVEAQLQVLTQRKRELRADTDYYISLCRDLELKLEARDDATEPWGIFRNVLALWTTYRAPVDKIAPFVRPSLASSASLIGSSRPTTVDATPRASGDIPLPQPDARPSSTDSMEATLEEGISPKHANGRSRSISKSPTRAPRAGSPRKMIPS